MPDHSTKIHSKTSRIQATAGKIGIVIALAVVIGKCMMDSGAADRVGRAFLSLLGEIAKRKRMDPLDVTDCNSSIGSLK